MATTETNAEIKEVEEHLEPVMGKICKLKVSIHSEGSKWKVEKLLQSIDGVYNINIDLMQQKVVVTGNGDSETLNEKLTKTGKHAELWPEEAHSKKKKQGKAENKEKESDPESNQISVQFQEPKQGVKQTVILRVANSPSPVAEKSSGGGKEGGEHSGDAPASTGLPNQSHGPQGPGPQGHGPSPGPVPIPSPANQSPPPHPISHQYPPHYNAPPAPFYPHEANLKGIMSREACAIVYLNGTVVQDDHGDKLDNVQTPEMVIIPFGTSLEKLKKIVLEELRISNNEVELIKFRCPVIDCNTMKYKIVALNNDRHVEHMLMMYSNYANWNIIELCVKTRYNWYGSEIDYN